MKDRKNITAIKEKIDNILFLSIFLIGVLNIFLNIVKLYNISSIFFKLSIIVIIGWGVVYFILLFIYKTKENKISSFREFRESLNLRHLINENRMGIYIFAFGIIGIISILISSKFNVPALSFFNQYIVVLACLVLFYLLFSVKIDEKILNLILIINLVFSYTIILLFFAGIARTWYGTTSWKNLTLNFSNPNPTGEFLLIVILFLVGTLLYHKRFSVKLLSAISVPFILFLLNITSSRNPVLSFFLSFGILFMFAKFKKVNKTMVCFLVVFPIIYIFLIMFFGYFSTYDEMLKNLFHKFEIYGRYYLWVEYFNEYSLSPIFGAYDLVGQTGFIKSFVNTYIMVLIVFGPLCFLLFLLIHYEFIYKLFVNNNESKKLMLFPALCFLSIYYLGLNEAGIYVGAGGIYIVGIYCSVIFLKYNARNTSSVKS